MGDLMQQLRKRLAQLVLPDTCRIVEFWCPDDPPEDVKTAANDLIRGGDALHRGWGCNPEILYNGAELLFAHSAREFRIKKLEAAMDGVSRRAEAAEAKLAKAKGALHKIAGKKDYADNPWGIARATLEELKKEN